MKLLSLVLSLGLLAAAAIAQAVPPNAPASDPIAGAGNVATNKTVPPAPNPLQKELDDVKANNAQLQQANQFWQIVADRNAQALMVVNQQTELANKNAEVARLNAELAKAQKEIDSLKAELKAARDGAKK